MADIGAYSRPHVLAKLDGRTREARLLRQTRRELLDHLGGRASVTQRQLVERAAWLSLRLAQLDGKLAAGGEAFTEHDSRTYLAWANAYARLLRQLGLKGAAERRPTLAEHLAGRGS